MVGLPDCCFGVGEGELLHWGCSPPRHDSSSHLCMLSASWGRSSPAPTRQACQIAREQVRLEGSLGGLCSPHSSPPSQIGFPRVTSSFRTPQRWRFLSLSGHVMQRSYTVVVKLPFSVSLSQINLIFSSHRCFYIASPTPNPQPMYKGLPKPTSALSCSAEGTYTPAFP